MLPSSSLSSLLSPLSPVSGFDLNPLAVMTARANYLIAMADLLPRTGRVEVPVYLCDSILGSGAAETCGAEFDYVVGNPPWIAWDNLPDEDRQATKPLWERYGLFSLSGRDARHGGGKKDLSMLMLYAAADRYLKPGGRLGMVITQTLFQTKGAGDGFRRFRLGAGRPAASACCASTTWWPCGPSQRRQLDQHDRAAKGHDDRVSRAVLDQCGTRGEEDAGGKERRNFLVSLSLRPAPSIRHGPTRPG